MSAECLSPQEKLKQLESFKGKSISEVVCALPSLPIFTQLELSSPEIIFHLVKYKIGRFEYELWQRRSPEWYQGPPQVIKFDRPDIPLPIIKAVQGEKINPSELDVGLGPGYALGITSRVRLTMKGDEKQGRYQIPMMDFDFDPDVIDEYGVLWTIRENLREMAEMGGLILKSSEKPGHFLFMGDQLLSDEQFLTFLGICLLMECEGRPLVDSRFIGHALTARMRDFLDLGSYDERYGSYSIYWRMNNEFWPYPDIFTTLRIKSEKTGYSEPKVIDVFGY